MLFSGVVLVMTGHPLEDAVRILFFFQHDESHFGFFYESMTDFVVFGLVVSVLLVEVQRQAQPENTCRAMAEEMRGHAVIFHYTNLGRRTWQLFQEHDIPVTVVEPNLANVEEVIRQGYPCLVASGRSAADVEAVNVAEARFVMTCSEDLESAAVICSLVRQRNPDCGLVVRCPNDDIGEVLAKSFNATVVSTSKVASRYLHDYIAKHQVNNCLVVGGSQLTRRMIPVLQDLKVDYQVLTHEANTIEDLVDEQHYVIGDAHDRITLEQAGVLDTNLVILTEDDLSFNLTVVDAVRDLNKDCRIVCRVFHDDAADVLKAQPFGCDIFSTSRGAVEQLRRQGAFRAMGLAGSSGLTPQEAENPSLKLRPLSRKPQIRKHR